MKLPSFINIQSSKVKIALVMLILMICVVLSNMYEKKMLQTSTKSIASLYADRLQPSTDIYEMRQLNADKIALLENIIQEKQISPNAIKELQKLESSFNELLIRYEKTYLVEEEKKYIALLKTEIDNLNQVSTIILNIKNQEVSSDLLIKLRAIAHKINVDLQALSKVQIKIGEELVSQFEKDVSRSSIINTVQIILSIFIGFLILIMFENPKKKLLTTEKHHLN
jgi:hypothetical protein